MSNQQHDMIAEAQKLLATAMAERTDQLIMETLMGGTDMKIGLPVESTDNKTKRLLAKLANMKNPPNQEEWEEIHTTACALVAKAVMKVLEENQGSMKPKPVFSTKGKVANYASLTDEQKKLWAVASINTTA